MLRLHVLVDNNTIIDRYYLGEPGASYYCEADGQTYLFDTGYSDVAMRNAGKMHIDLLQTDGIVLSHGHNDHTWGLVPLLQAYPEALAEGIPYKAAKVIAHPDVFCPKRMGTLNIGTLLSEAQLGQVLSVHTTAEPLWLNEHFVFLGEIPRVTDFEARQPIGETCRHGEWRADYLRDDSALVYKSAQGLVIITGCSHAGICNITAYARQVCQEDRVRAIVGGFHLLHCDEDILEKTAQYLATCQPAVVYPCHCTDLKAKLALSRYLPVQELGVGTVLEFS